MDIQHALDACAITTLGKDTTLRDHAQGCYRMRGLGKGQTVHVILIPSVLKLIGGSSGNDVPKAGNRLQEMFAWLVSKQIASEMLQHTMLTKQNLDSCWRREALAMLLASTAPPKGRYLMLGDKRIESVPATFGAQEYELCALSVLAVPEHGNSTLANDVKGKIVLVRRGKVSAATKVKNAQDAGALAVIVMENPGADGGKKATRMKADAPDVTIPSVFVGSHEANLLLDAPGVLVSMHAGSGCCALLSRFRAPIEDDDAIRSALAQPGIFSANALAELEEEQRVEQELKDIERRVDEVRGVLDAKLGADTIGDALHAVVNADEAGTLSTPVSPYSCTPVPLPSYSCTPSPLHSVYPHAHAHLIPLCCIAAL